ncbi:MAG: Crp/Fnr family transcriptional regulator [Planctomycetaceae bacterium]|nr:Crp/Fnr family transcriptional regulator [Planctomycetaceae bacterium]
MFVHALSASHFLMGIPEAIQFRLAELAEPRDLATGEIIFLEGQSHDRIYLVETGQIRLEMSVPGGDRVAMLTVGPGEFLGWSPLFGHKTMSASAVAAETTRCWSFSGDALRKLCETEHDIGYYVMKQFAIEISKRLTATRLQLLDMYAEYEPRRSKVPSTA